MKKYTVMALVMAFLVAFILIQSPEAKKSSSSYPKSETYKSPKPKSDKTTHVKGYYRKDGSYVHPYDRKPPHEKLDKPNTPKEHKEFEPHITKSNHKGCTTCPRDSRGRIKRSTSAKNEFKKSHPCPVTHKSTGSCPGYVIDHIKSLKRGGADAPENMQWQTKEDAKKKDKIE